MDSEALEKLHLKITALH